MRPAVLRAGIFALVATLIAHNAIGIEANWPRVYANILISEGGARYTDHPSDPGGPTKFGITIHDVRKHIRRDATAEDVRNLTEAQARIVFEAHYWNHPCVRGAALPAGLDYTVTDFGVNSGVGRAGKFLRDQLGFSTETCVLTEAVFGRLDRMSASERMRFIRNYNARRLAFLKGLRTFPVFGRGWTNRVRSVEAISIRMATPGLRGSADSIRPAFGPARAFDDDSQEENYP